MRKLISAIMAAAVAVSCFAGAITASAKQTSAGDVNGDGKINSSDALEVLMIAVGTKDSTDEIIEIGDIDRNGALSSSDALYILQYAVGNEFSIEGVRIDAENRAADVGDSFTVKAAAYPAFAEDTDVSWSSSDNSIATVDENGNVSVVGNGVAVITCKSNENSKAFASFEINSIKVLATSVSLDRKSDSVGIGRIIQLNASVKPSNAYNKRFTWKSSDPYVATVDENGKVHARSIGSATITCTTVDGSKKSASYKISVGRINFDYCSQLPNYPTGCEAASAVMLLKAYGYNVSMDEMVGLIPRENLSYKGGVLYGPDIHEKFVGDPRGTYTSGNPGYGAFSPVITKALQKAIDKHGGGCTAVNFSGVTYEEMLNIVSDGHPVIAWATYDMKNPTQINEWYINGTNEYFSYPRGTHVMVICGYDKDTVWVMDPYGFSQPKKYGHDLFKARWELLGKQAITLVKNK